MIIPRNFPCTFFTILFVYSVVIASFIIEILIGDLDEKAERTRAIIISLLVYLCIGTWIAAYYHLLRSHRFMKKVGNNMVNSTPYVGVRLVDDHLMIESAYEMKPVSTNWTVNTLLLFITSRLFRFRVSCCRMFSQIDAHIEDSFVGPYIVSEDFPAPRTVKTVAVESAGVDLSGESGEVLL